MPSRLIFFHLLASPPACPVQLRRALVAQFTECLVYTVPALQRTSSGMPHSRRTITAHTNRQPIIIAANRQDAPFSISLPNATPHTHTRGHSRHQLEQEEGLQDIGNAAAARECLPPISPSNQASSSSHVQGLPPPLPRLTPLFLPSFPPPPRTANGVCPVQRLEAGTRGRQGRLGLAAFQLSLSGDAQHRQRFARGVHYLGKRRRGQDDDGSQHWDGVGVEGEEDVRD